MTRRRGPTTLYHLLYAYGQVLNRRAQAGEAGTAETVKQGSVHEHAVGSADAPKMNPQCRSMSGEHR